MAEIIKYDELKDYYQFLRLMDAAFSWAVTPERIANIRRLDRRFAGPWGYGLMEGRELVGFVGVADIPARMRDGRTENIGGIHLVATLPGHGRQGIATRLLERAHSYFRRKGYRFALLCSSRSLVAHSLYERLGYADIESVYRTPQAYKILANKSKTQDPKPKNGDAAPAIDWNAIEQTFQRCFRRWTGLAVRPSEWAAKRASAMGLKPENIVVVDGGYAIHGGGPDVLYVLEIAGRNRRVYLKLLKPLEAIGKPIMSDCYVRDPVLLRIYREQGYAFRWGNNAVVMCKPLTDTEFKPAFGNRFFFSTLDRF